MKKIKFMLLSLALLAVVGGALAFKAKYTADWCSTTAKFVSGVGSTCVDGGNITCPNLAVNSTTIANDDDAPFYCTTNAFIVSGQFACERPKAGGGVETAICTSTTYTTVVPDGL